MSSLLLDKLRQREYPKISEVSRRILEMEKFQNEFCDTCPWKEHHDGTFNEASGFGEPPYCTCPADFDLASPLCPQRDRVLDILAMFDELAGFEGTVAI